PQHGKAMSFLSKVFALNPQGLNWPRAVMFLDVALVPLVVLLAIGKEQYLLSALFGTLFAGMVDPGGSYGYRASRLAVFGLAGAAITALGFGIATSGWGWLVLAAFIITLVAGLTIRFGLHRFIVALILNTWFFVALVLGSNHHNAHIADHTWAQALAWAGGTAVWIALTFIGWLIRGRKDRPPPIAELPGDTSPRQLTRPLIVFAVLRALGMAGATAIAFGAGLSHADWTPIAAMVAMKPSLDQTGVVAAQRLTGALIGAAAATLLMLIAASETGLKLISIRHALEVVVIVIYVHGAGIRFWNYAFYTACLAAGTLLAVDLPHPSNYSAEGDRVLYTLIGVAIAVLVMLAGNLLAKLTAKAPPHAAPHPA
ncbi:MAG TPA: FUSC family protein, partial [Solirubrobacteraceae bacterium]|nr:FUSC family protein [Solirubrobacteraceae bacterium]